LVQPVPEPTPVVQAAAIIGAIRASTTMAIAAIDRVLFIDLLLGSPCEESAQQKNLAGRPRR
jgi:hypothetical protein